MNRLENKVAVITGGASGIGDATVRLFATAGAKVVIADVQDHRGRLLAESLGHEQAVYRHTDVSRESDVMAMIEVALTNGRVLRSPAGASWPGP